MNEREEGVQHPSWAKSISLSLTIIIIILTLINTFIDFHETLFNAVSILNVILNSLVIMIISYWIYLIIVNKAKCDYDHDYEVEISGSFKICFVNLITGFIACFTSFISYDYIDIYIFILFLRLPFFFLLEKAFDIY